MRVIVPFGPRKIMGYVVDRVSESSFDQLKELIDILDLTPILTAELLNLGKWLAEETLSLYITAFQAMLPQVLKANYKKELERLTSDSLPRELEALFAGRDFVSYEELENAQISYHQVQKAIQAGEIAVHYLVKSRVTKKHVTFLKPAREIHLLEEALGDMSNKAKKQQEILAFFIDHPEEIELNRILN